MFKTSIFQQNGLAFIAFFFTFVGKKNNKNEFVGTKKQKNMSHAEMIYLILPVCAIKSIYGHMKMATAEAWSVVFVTFPCMSIREKYEKKF